MVIQQLNIWKKNDVSNNRVGEKCKEKRCMIFLLQKEEGHDYDIDVRILKDELEKNYAMVTRLYFMFFREYGTS